MLKNSGLGYMFTDNTLYSVQYTHIYVQEMNLWLLLQVHLE